MKKIVVLVVLLLSMGCAKAWKPGGQKYISYRERLHAELLPMDTDKLMDLLDDAKTWQTNLPGSARYQRHKIKYYVAIDLLSERLMDPGVYDFFVKMAGRGERDSVARDAIRFLDAYFDQEDFKENLVDQLVELYAAKRTHPAARKEILNVFIERRVKAPQMLWHIHDLRKENREELDIEDMYIGFLNAG